MSSSEDMGDPKTKKEEEEEPDGGCNDELLPHRVDESLLEPYRYISSVPGKDVRGTLIDCFNAWFHVNTDSIDLIKRVVASLHNASLLIDDIEDNSKLRRGIPTAHTIFGVPTVINCANYVYFMALEDCHRMNNEAATKVFLGEILNLHRGQGQDIAWREGLTCPTENEYLSMVSDKTGGLFRLAVGLLQAHATCHAATDFTRLVNNLAIYFQIRDDYVNLADVEYFKSKSFCEDLTEGKFSFPMIHCIRSNPDDHRLLNILRQRTEDVEIKRYAQRLLREAGSLAYTRAKCRQVKGAIIDDVVRYGGNPALLRLLEVLDVQLDQMEDGGTAAAPDDNRPGGSGSRVSTSSERGDLHIDET